MAQPTAGDDERFPTHAAIERVFREESGRIIATLIRVFGSFDLAEEVLQEALISALDHWPRDGVPENPGAWITTAARRKAIDRLRKERTQTEKQTILRGLAELQQQELPEDIATRPRADDRLRLIFTCCHPALNVEAQVALTLRTLGGLNTAEIARAFLLPEATLAQRLVRAKHKIRDAGIPYRVPPPEHFPERLDAVLAVLYLIFNEGYSASSGDSLIRQGLCREAIRHARLLAQLMPDEAEALALLALMLLHDSRRGARVGPAGELIVLEEQDRARWDAAAIVEGLAVLERALACYGVAARRSSTKGRSRAVVRPRPPGRIYLTQAAIAALHAQARSAAETDWQQIATLYGELARVSDSPVVQLNRAAAVAMAEGPGAGLALLDRAAVAQPLQRYHLYHAARADLLRRAGRRREAVSAYDQAIELCANSIERDYLLRRRGEVRG